MLRVLLAAALSVAMGAIPLLPANASFEGGKGGAVPVWEGRPSGYGEVVSILRGWDIEGARGRLAELREENPDFPEWEALAGAIAYFDGKYSESLRRLNAALRARPGEREWLELRLHVRQSRAAVEGFAVHRTPHFAIWYDPKTDSVLLPYLAEALEKGYEVLGKVLGERPEKPTRIEVFSDAARFHKASTLSRRDIEDKGAVGISKFNKFMMISPGALLRGYRWLDTAVHEYAHLLIVRASKNRTPIWLHEGIAKFVETRWRNAQVSYLDPAGESLLSRARAQENFIGFRKMEPSLIYLKTPEEIQLAYVEAASAADFIERRLGPGGLTRMLHSLGEVADKKWDALTQAKLKGRGLKQRLSSLVELESTSVQSAEPGLLAVLGVDLAGFEKIWRADLAKMPLRSHPGAKVRKFQLKPTGPVDERTSDIAALSSAVARRRMRLADRFLTRGRHRAAWAEYKRALRTEPYSTSLLNRLARIEIRLGLPGKALENLQRAQEIDPDHGLTYVHLGVLYEMMGQSTKARIAWEQAIQINPFDPLAHERLAVIYDQAGHGDKAKRERNLARNLARR